MLIVLADNNSHHTILDPQSSSPTPQRLSHSGIVSSHRPAYAPRLSPFAPRLSPFDDRLALLPVPAV
jgi:hypothetical protein